MSIGTLTSKGQITIPNEVRKRLRLKAGDRIEFKVEADGKVTLQPLICRTADVFGCLSTSRKRKCVSAEDMNLLLAEALRRGKR